MFDDEGAKWCPRCGVPEPLSDAAAALRAGSTSSGTKSSGSSWWKWVLGVPVVLFILMMVLGTINSNPEQNSARRAYETCMSSLADADRARSGTGSFIAGACEKMRNDYIAKYRNNP
jgi:hypothetical protein